MSENNCAVYQIVNERTLKFYIGSAKNFGTRYGRNHDWTRHKNKELKQDAIRGDKFMYIKMQKCSSLEEALCMEQWWFDFYIKNNLWSKLYNRNKSVYRLRCDNTGRKASDEERAKNSAALKIVMNTPEARAKNSASKKIALNTPEARAKNSASKKIAWSIPEIRARMNAAQNRPDVKAKRSAALKIAWSSPEVRARIIIAQKIAQSKPETKAKSSGENSHNAKLTNLKVLDIREKYAYGETLSMLAKQFNVSGSTIRRIVHRQTWKLI